MDPNNPYQAPSATFEEAAPLGMFVDVALLDRVASGQRLINYSILTYLTAAVVKMVTPVSMLVGALAGMGVVAALIMGLIGAVRITNGMAVAMRIIIFLGLFVPLINLLVLLYVNSRATRVLRKGGYTVGLLGAKKRR